MDLKIISWNARGIRNVATLAALKGYVYQHHPSVVFIQEAFVGPLLGDRDAPPLNGYVSYVHPVRNGLISYVHASVTHKLVQTSAGADMTYQLLEITFGSGKLRLCNVYSAPGIILLDDLPPPSPHGMIYMGDFNARHPDLGDTSPVPNRNGLRLLNYII